MLIKKIVVGEYQANCYLVSDGTTKEAVIIDPGAEPEKIIAAIKDNGLKPKFILITHNHLDHIGALKEIKHFASCPPRFAGEAGDDVSLKNGEGIRTGEMGIKIIETPGHTPESACFIIGGNIFSGDTLFKQGIGRTDLGGGDFNQIQKSLKRLMEFPDHFKVLPGHGEETTIGEERKTNSFLQFQNSNLRF